MGMRPTNPLDEFAILGKSDQTLVGDVLAARNIKSLQTLAVFCNGIDGLLCDIFIVGYVKGKQRRAPLYQRDETEVCQVAAVGKSQALNSRADCEGLYASVIDILRKVG
jgi:hypothetical protein